MQRRMFRSYSKNTIMLREDFFNSIETVPHNSAPTYTIPTSTMLSFASKLPNCLIEILCIVFFAKIPKFFSLELVF